MTVPELLLDVTARATLLLGPALLFARFARRPSAATRHLVCLAAILLALALPALRLAGPEVALPILPARAGPETARAAPAEAGVGEDVLLAGIWAAGALVLVAARLRGVARAAALVRRATEARDARLLTEAIRARADLGLGRPLRILLHPSLAVPFTFGVRRAAVVMPAAAVRWPRGRTRAVLLHELAHVGRRDWLTQILADLACALLWFHPLAWLAARRMRTEREIACDDRVVGRGARPSRYAKLLLKMLFSMRAAPACAAAFGRENGLNGRVRALLGGRRDRAAPGPARTAALFAAGFLAAVLLAAVRPEAKMAERPPAPRAITSAAAPAVPARPEPPAPAELPRAGPPVDSTHLREQIVECLSAYLESTTGTEAGRELRRLVDPEDFVRLLREGRIEGRVSVRVRSFSR